VVHRNIREFWQNCDGYAAAFKQYGNDPELIPGEPHFYMNAEGKAKVTFYTPRKNCLLDIDTNKFKIEELILILRKVLVLIIRIHHEGGAHRDIKIDNIFIERNPLTREIQVFILDFDFYTRRFFDNLDKGTLQNMWPSTWGRFDLTLGACQANDLLGTVSVAIALFCSNKFYNIFMGLQKTPKKRTHFLLKCAKEFEEAGKNPVSFQQHLWLLLANTLYWKEGYRDIYSFLVQLDKIIALSSK
jgi:serine/threonine protein kinase